MLLFFILFVPLFVLILLGVHTLVATSNPDPAKLSGYECGFSSVSDARQKFQISFFLVAILFIVFDLEILFIYPLVISLYHVSYFGFWIAMVFVLLLTVGLVYELCSGVLDYARTPSSSSSSKTQIPPSAPEAGKTPSLVGKFWSAHYIGDFILIDSSGMLSSAS
jgi:NADH:ubiquinone oxidoreductase subunit 3 (subunit A)